MAKYFPQHFKRNRGYSKTAVEQLVGMRKQGARFLDMRGPIQEIVSRDHATKTNATANGALAQNAFLSSFQHLLSTGFLFSEGMGALNHVEFELNESVVFDVDPSLASELKDSDSDELVIGDVDPPFSAFYIHVGPQADIVFNDSVVFEGAYIRCSPTDWLITICGRRPGNWWGDPADWHTLRMTAETFETPLPQAIEQALEIDRSELMERHSQLKSQGMITKEYVESVLAKNNGSAEALKKALNLCVQVLAYIVSYREDQKRGWQDDTPEKMREKADHAATPKERERNESKLRSMGFWKVIKVGHEFGRAHLEAARSGERTPHSRRGHWRRQRHGQGFSLTKLIYIQRTFVMGSAAKRSLE
jgi:hypothetical protein